MGSKNNPGKFDCYENAEPDEPMFILLGRDPIAAELVRIWAMIKDEITEGAEPDVVAEADKCADAMDEWAAKLGKRHVSISVANFNVKDR